MRDRPARPSRRSARAPRSRSGSLHGEAVSTIGPERRAPGRADPRAAQPCVVLTGAGVCTESGIPDFRSPTGIWAKFDPLEYALDRRLPPRPAQGLELLRAAVAMLTEAEPNAAHVALAELERLGFVEAVVTQNIDLLHERAGSRDVVEVHGSIRTRDLPGLRRALLARARARAARPTPSARLPVVRRGCSSPTSSSSASCCRRGDRTGLRSSRRGAAAARRRLVARGLPGGGTAGGDPRRRRQARDRQPRAHAVRREGDLRVDARAGRGSRRGRRRPELARRGALPAGARRARACTRSRPCARPRTGIPSRWRSTYVRTPVCRWSLRCMNS